jgi:biopolymer transport protein ExbD/biopolymer transport protein TolR
MAFDVNPTPGRPGMSRPEMNVTPLVDVVLVLLIIFMVLTATMNEKFWVHVPEKEKPQQALLEEETDPGQGPIVVSVNAHGRVQINQDVYSDGEFPDRLRRMLVARGERKIYFDAQPGVPFERAMEVLDSARGAGAAHIAVATESLAP